MRAKGNKVKCEAPESEDVVRFNKGNDNKIKVEQGPHENTIQTT